MGIDTTVAYIIMVPYIIWLFYLTYKAEASSNKIKQGMIDVNTVR